MNWADHIAPLGVLGVVLSSSAAATKSLIPAAFRSMPIPLAETPLPLLATLLPQVVYDVGMRFQRGNPERIKDLCTYAGSRNGPNRYRELWLEYREFFASLRMTQDGKSWSGKGIALGKL